MFVGINFDRDKEANLRNPTLILISNILYFTLRIMRKLGIKIFYLEIEKLAVKYQVKGASSDSLVSMIGDRSHKLLQEALGQSFTSNQYFVSKLLEEAKRRNINSRTAKWGQKIYDDFLAGDLYKYSKDSSKTFDEFTIDTKQLENFHEIVTKRQSIRKFSSQKVPVDVVKRILECSIEAPSSCNRQSWRFFTITETQDLEYLAKMRGVNFLRDTPLVICSLCNMDVYTSNAQGDRRITPIMDASAAITNAINACSAAGLGSAWVNFAASVTPEKMKTVKQHFNIEDKYLVIGLIAVGFHNVTIPKPFRDRIDNYWINMSE